MLLFGVATTSPAAAQDTTVDGAYERLSPGNQKIARALWEAQQPAPGTTTRSSDAAAKSLTLDEVAAQKQSGQGWGQVFRTMKGQGLVQEKNLGQVVSRYARPQYRGVGVVTTAGNRPLPRATSPGVRPARGKDGGTVTTARGRSHAHGAGGSHGGGSASVAAAHGGGQARAYGSTSAPGGRTN
jgi:hypothetical protein